MGVYDDTYIYIGDEENFGLFYWLLCSFAFYLWFILTCIFLYNRCWHVKKFIYFEKATKFKKSPDSKGDFFKNIWASQKVFDLLYKVWWQKLNRKFLLQSFFITQRKTKQCWHLKNDPCSDMEQQISQGYLLAFIFVFYPGGGHYKNIQHVKGRRR